MQEAVCELLQSTDSQPQPLMGITGGACKPAIAWVPPTETLIGLGFILELSR